MVDPKTFKTDEDWTNAGYEFAFWLNKYERTYVVTNGRHSIVMVDEGNGHCHYFNDYAESEVMAERIASELDNLVTRIKYYFNHRNMPIYKVITLSIREDERPSHEMFGWYHNCSDAVWAVVNNALDMQDHAFNYALVSRSYQGGYGLNDEELQWYKWNYTDEKWEKCERPDVCDDLKFV